MVAGAAIEGSLALPAAALALAGLGLAIAVLRRAGSRPAPRRAVRPAASPAPKRPRSAGGLNPILRSPKGFVRERPGARSSAGRFPCGRVAPRALSV